MALVLLLLCAVFSVITITGQHPSGTAGGELLAARVVREIGPGSRVLVVARDTREEREFADVLATRLGESGVTVTAVVKGQPPDVRVALEETARGEEKLDALACTHTVFTWEVVERAGENFPELAGVRVLEPQSYLWPNFLKADNLLNVANQIVVIAIVAIGMTLVIITAGIDLSVGSLIALSAVVAALFMRDVAGASEATVLGMILSCLGAIAVCGLVGSFTGAMVTVFDIPPFIVTLAMMLVASGLAYHLAAGQSIHEIPGSFVWLGVGADFLSIPNAVLLMLVLYTVAHVLMTRMALGRYIYAVGGNREAARLSGVPVRRVLLFVYTLCGCLAGLGGVITASQLKGGSPNYGHMYELYVIAAVVVGGTSLAGGEGKILGTLIGAFIIAVIRNGMNLTGVESYTQNVILGLVILGAVLLDRLKKRGFLRLPRRPGAVRRGA
jgi:ribose transport system permease protein